MISDHDYVPNSSSCSLKNLLDASATIDAHVLSEVSFKALNKIEYS